MVCNVCLVEDDAQIGEVGIIKALTCFAAMFNR